MTEAGAAGRSVSLQNKGTSTRGSGAEEYRGMLDRRCLPRLNRRIPNATVGTKYKYRCVQDTEF